MTVSRILFRSAISLACVLIATLISGCATPAKIPGGPAPQQPTAMEKEKTSGPAALEKPADVLPARAIPAAPDTAPASPPAEPAPAVTIANPPAKVQHATIVGSQESSILLDNFTAFVTAVDGKKIAAGRNGWNDPVEIETGQRTLSVEFNRGVFLAKGRVEFDAVAHARYELKFTTDAELFGHNSYCNFWVVDVDNGKTVSMVSKDSVEKIAEAPAQ